MRAVRNLFAGDVTRAIRRTPKRVVIWMAPLLVVFVIVTALHLPTFLFLMIAAVDAVVFGVVGGRWAAEDALAAEMAESESSHIE